MILLKTIKDYLKKGFEVSVYLVGDIVTQDFLASNFLKPLILLCIVDEKTQRNHIKIEIDDFFEEIIELVKQNSKKRTGGVS